jgi:hypothetical protein
MIMSIQEHKYLWEEEKNDWVLVRVADDFCIINKVTQMVLLVSDEELEKALIAKMLDCGNKIYDTLDAAYKDI